MGFMKCPLLSTKVVRTMNDQPALTCKMNDSFLLFRCSFKKTLVHVTRGSSKLICLG